MARAAVGRDLSDEPLRPVLVLFVANASLHRLTRRIEDPRLLVVEDDLELMRRAETFRLASIRPWRQPAGCVHRPPCWPNGRRHRRTGSPPLRHRTPRRGLATVHATVRSRTACRFAGACRCPHFQAPWDRPPSKSRARRWSDRPRRPGLNASAKLGCRRRGRRLAGPVLLALVIVLLALLMLQDNSDLGGSLDANRPLGVRRIVNARTIRTVECRTSEINQAGTAGRQVEIASNRWPSGRAEGVLALPDAPKSLSQSSYDARRNSTETGVSRQREWRQNVSVAL